MPEKCPKCGAESGNDCVSGGGSPLMYYICGSMFRKSDGQKYEQSKQCLRNQIAQLREKLAAAEAVVKPLNALRDEEGSTVRVCCDNPSFDGPGCKVTVNRTWPDGYRQLREFTGENLADALKAAAKAKEQE